MTADTLFKILGNKIRLRLLCLLRDRQLRVGDLQAITGLPMAVISKDLMRLRAKHLVAATRRGISITYFLPQTPESELLRSLLAAAEKAFPPEVRADAEALRQHIPSELPQTAAPEKSFCGNTIRPRKNTPAETAEQSSEKSENSDSHFGELPTNLL